MNAEKMLGFVYYKNDYYFFSFDNYMLQLIPRKKEDLIEFKIKNTRLSDEQNTFDSEDAIVFYFEVRKIGNELLKIINHSTCNKTYEINEDF